MMAMAFEEHATLSVRTGRIEARQWVTRLIEHFELLRYFESAIGKDNVGFGRT